MDLISRFSADQLERIIDEAAIYMCACPAKVCQQIVELRELYCYQRECVANSGDPAVHNLIATHTAAAIKELEDCLAAVLDLEGWDLVTLRMPPNLRVLRDKQIADLTG